MIDALLDYDPRTKKSHIRIFLNDFVIHEFHLDNKEAAEEIFNKLNSKRLKDLKNVCDIQCSEGNYNYSKGMFGMAQGLILAVATVENSDPVFLDEPKQFTVDK